MTDEEVQAKLLNNFKLRGTDFYGIVGFYPRDIGFSVKKKFNHRNGFISLIKIAVLKDSQGSTNLKKPLYVSAAYGKLNQSGSGLVYLDNDDKKSFRKEPIDIQTAEDYFFDLRNGKIYKKDKPIKGADLLAEIYKAHLSSWHTYTGLLIRVKLELFRTVSSAWGVFSKLAEYTLFIISGDRYSFDPFMAGFEEEANKLYGDGELKETDKKGKRIEFLGNKASAWAVIFYCVVHLMVYAALIITALRPTPIMILFRNNFLTIAYVVVTLWLVDTAIPIILKRLIKFFSNASFNLKNKKISINL